MMKMMGVLIGIFRKAPQKVPESYLAGVTQIQSLPLKTTHFICHIYFFGSVHLNVLQ